MTTSNRSRLLIEFLDAIVNQVHQIPHLQQVQSQNPKVVGGPSRIKNEPTGHIWSRTRQKISRPLLSWATPLLLGKGQNNKRPHAGCTSNPLRSTAQPTREWRTRFVTTAKRCNTSHDKDGLYLSTRPEASYARKSEMTVSQSTTHSTPLPWWHRVAYDAGVWKEHLVSEWDDCVESKNGSVIRNWNACEHSNWWFPLTYRCYGMWLGFLRVIKSLALKPNDLSIANTKILCLFNCINSIEWCGDRWCESGCWLADFPIPNPHTWRPQPAGCPSLEWQTKSWVKLWFREAILLCINPKCEAFQPLIRNPFL
jgi:hypothetical protein